MCGAMETAEAANYGDGYGSEKRGKEDQKKLEGWMALALYRLEGRTSEGVDGTGNFCPECAKKTGLRFFR